MESVVAKRRRRGPGIHHDPGEMDFSNRLRSAILTIRGLKKLQVISDEIGMNQGSFNQWINSKKAINEYSINQIVKWLEAQDVKSSEEK